MKNTKLAAMFAVMTALAAVVVVPFASNRSPEAPANVLINDQAISHLKEDGTFDSLAKAVEETRYGFETAGNGHSAQNPANQFSAKFTPNGSVEISDRDSGWQSAWELKSVGRGNDQSEVGKGEWSNHGNRIENHRAAIHLTEYFENRPSGLEQVFILGQRPSGGDGNIRLILQTSGDLTATASPDGQRIIMTGDNGSEVLSYEKLLVWDSNQTELMAKIQPGIAGEVWLDVDDTNAVYPLTIDPTYVQRQRLLAGDRASGDLFGTSVAISGTTAIVGASEKALGGNVKAGAAYVFVQSGTTWTFQAKLLPGDTTANKYFGQSVSISGDTAVVGANGDGFGRGAAYVFIRSGVTWSPQDKLLASDGVAGDLFGTSVGVSGDTVVVGANGYDGTILTNQGAVYAFVRNGGVWTQQQKMTASPATSGAEFGNAISLSGGTAIVGAYGETVGGNAQQGAAYVFLRSGSIWSQQGRLTASDGAAADRFGTSVDISLPVSGAVAVVGSRDDNVAGNAAQGSAYVYNRSGTTWSQAQKLIASDGDADNQFGGSVAIVPGTGDEIFVGATGNRFSRGAVYAFKRINNVWSEQQRMISSRDSLQGRFGSSVDASSEVVLAGAENDDNLGTSNSGAAYLFKFGGTPFDFDGDEKTDLSVYRPSLGQWWISRSSDNSGYGTAFGITTDKIVPADFDGDGKTDIANYRQFANNCAWYMLLSEAGYVATIYWGLPNDLAATGDFNEDGRSDLAIFRPSTATWFIMNNLISGAYSIRQFGANGDLPAIADYDGDGKADLAIFRPNGATGTEWWVERSSNGTVFAVQFGSPTDKPVPGDYTGDGKADIAFWRPSTGQWFILRSEDFSYYAFPFGSSTDIAAPGDYDGDGKFDAAVFRPSTATWYANRSTGGTLIQQFGQTGDLPVPGAFVR